MFSMRIIRERPLLRHYILYYMFHGYYLYSITVSLFTNSEQGDRNAVKAKTSNNYVGPISKCTTVRLMWPWTNNDDDQLIMCRRTADIQGIIQSRPQPPRVMPTANKQILQFGQMQFSIWTNTLDIQESRFSSHYPIQAKYFQAIQTKFAIKTNTNTYMICNRLLQIRFFQLII